MNGPTRNGSNGSIASLPIWARVAATIGLPALAAAYLLYNVVAVQGAQINDILDGVTAQQIAGDQMATDIQTLIRVNRQVCLNTATSDAQRQLCVQ